MNFAHWSYPSFVIALLFSAATALSAEENPARSFNISEHATADAVDEATPAADSIGNNCLVVWKDNRANNQPYHQGRYLLYGRRFDLSGNALDAASFQIQDEPFVWNNEGLTLPSVGAMGRDYLVVWLTRFRHVSAKRVSRDGTVATNEIQIARTGNATGQPVFASTRRSSFVAWTTRTNNNGDIYGTLLDRRGEVVRVIPVAVGAANAQYPVVAAAGRNYLVVWRELSPSLDGYLKAALVTESGEVQPLEDFSSATATRAAIASNGRNYFVTWQADGTEYGSGLMGCSLNCRGTMTRHMPLAATGPQALPAVLASGASFTVLWRDNPYSDDAQLYSLAISTRGVPKNTPSPMASDMNWSGYGSATTLNPSDTLVVLEQKTPDYYDNGYLSRVRASIVSSAR